MQLRLPWVLIPVFLLGFPLSVSAAATQKVNVQKLMQARACAGCHAAKTQVIGPAWSWIAWRYRKTPGNASINEVANFIISGGTGYWEKWTGGIPMPAHPDLSQQQAQAIARWILAQPPAQPPDAGD